MVKNDMMHILGQLDNLLNYPNNKIVIRDRGDFLVIVKGTGDCVTQGLLCALMMSSSDYTSECTINGYLGFAIQLKLPEMDTCQVNELF